MEPRPQLRRRARRVAAAIALAVLAIGAPAVPAIGTSDAWAASGQKSAGSERQFLPLPQENPLTPQIYPVSSLTKRPRHFALNGRQAIRLSAATDVVREARAQHPNLRPRAFLSPLAVPQGHFWHWDIIWSADGKQLAEAEIGPNGGVLTQIHAKDIGWPLLEGLPGVLGKKLNAPYVWLPLCIVFLLPFLDPRRPWRLVHLDLMMLLGFGVSQFFFNRGQADVSVPLVYPFLIYVVVRGAFAGFRPRVRAGPLIPYATTRVLVVGVVILMALRIGFGIFGSEAFDIGRAGAIGADRIEHGQQLYVDNEAHGDTYGPLNYLLYVPAELLFPYGEGHEQAPIAATLMFDVLMVAGLVLLGRRLRAGPEARRLAAALAWTWAAFPYSALILAADTNDALVPLFVVYALCLVASPTGRGLLTGLGTMTKFAPGLLAPLLVVGRGPLRWRPAAVAGTAFAGVCVALVWAFLPDGGVREFWNTTLGFQLHRTSPLSLWDRFPSWHSLKLVATVFAAAFAVIAAFLPRRRTVGQLAALCAALLAAVQIAGSYWLYFYVAWFAPFLAIAAFEEYGDLGPDRTATSR